MNPLLMNNKSFPSFLTIFNIHFHWALFFTSGLSKLMNYKRERWQVAFLILTAEHLKCLKKSQMYSFSSDKNSIKKRHLFLITNLNSIGDLVNFRTNLNDFKRLIFILIKLLIK
jgi:hypothetical protein